MPSTNPIAKTFASLLLAAAGLAGVCGAQQPAPSVLDPKIELMELQTTLQVAHAKIQELERQVAAAKSQNTALAQSAAAANAESGQFKENYEKLRGLLEGLGIGALENSTDQVQERLITALSDLRVVDEQKRKVSESLMELSEAALNFAKGSQNADAAARERLEKSLATAEGALRAASLREDDAAPAKDLHQAKIVSLKPETGVAVLDVGSRDGVRPGMPFEVFRQDKPIARVVVVEARKAISGAVIEELMNKADPIQVGDQGRVSANRTF